MTVLAEPKGMAESEANPYDVVPYESHAFDFTDPQRLHAIGRLFGMTPPDFRKARVLELGCAGGGNILPMAFRYPDAEFVGVDLSAVQIGQARELAEEVGAKNIVFRQMSITDITPEFGAFDYIICHGVFSWVPAPVRDAILSISKQNLTPNGIALISYNTLPGWYQVRAVREMMLYHCARFPTLKEKIEQGIALLRFVLESANAGLVAYRESLQNELNLLTSQRAYYIFHEHLENENHALHLHEMAAQARAEGLEYLGDVNLETMFTHNFSPLVVEKLAAVDDIVRIEQYLDFITNRRFRISLFGHRGVTIRRNLDSAQILDFHIGSRVLPPADSVDLSRDVRTVFKMQNGAELTAENRYAAAYMSVLASLGNRIARARDIVSEATSKVSATPDAEARIRAAFVEFGLRLAFCGGLVLHSAAPSYTGAVSRRPVGFAPARAVSRRNDIVPSVFHARLTLGSAERVLIQACDGTRDRGALVDVIAESVARGELSVQRSGQPISDPAQARTEIESWVGGMLARFAELGLLTA